jgi:hypothetical protein
MRAIQVEPINHCSTAEVDTRMLDLSYPITQYRFQASGLMDGVMARGQRMSVSPSVVRAELLTECRPLFAAMRELARSQFSKQATFIIAAVDEYEAAILDLAALGGGCITVDRRDGTGSCPVCGTAITHYPKHRIVLCGECDKPFMAAYGKLDSSAGFGTWVI